MTLQLVNRSMRKPWVIVEDVMVTVEKLVFFMDFVILDINGNIEAFLILGRRFLNTSSALINWSDGNATLKVGEKEVVYILLSAMEHFMNHDDEYYFVHEPDLSISNLV